MANRPALATQADVTRALKGVLAAGVPLDRIAGVKATKEGVIVLLGDPSRGDSEASPNEWDEVLK